MDDLDLTEKTPRAYDDDQDDQLKALPRARAARGSTILSPPPIPARARRAATLPPPLPAGARRASAQHAVPPMFSPTMAPSKLVPFLPRQVDAPPVSLVPPVPRPPTHDEEPHVARAPLESFDIDVDLPEPSKQFEHTAPVQRRGLGAYIAAGLGAAFVVGVLAIYFTGKQAEPAPAPAEPAITAASPPQPPPPAPPPVEPTPAPQPVAVVEPPPPPTLDQMIDDLSDEELARLEERIRDRRTAKAPEAAPAPEPTPAPARRRTKKVAAAPAPSGSGILMVSSKPPCNIAIDGKPTRMVTPQRAIALPAGVHKITLTNTQQRISKTISVTIDPKKPTKLIQDFTK